MHNLSTFPILAERSSVRKSYICLLVVDLVNRSDSAVWQVGLMLCSRLERCYGGIGHMGGLYG
jgi:hypothetical protein